MSYYLGIDGGGTKTDCVLLDAHGQVLRRAQGGPSNPLRGGYTRAWFSVSGTADMVLARQSLKATDISGICGGFGGAARPAVAKRMSVFLERSFPKAEVRVTSDIEIALAAAVEKGAGVVLIAGTGSVAYGRNADGQTVRAGGWGPWLGDQGSAFDIGRSALTAVRRHEDGLGPPQSFLSAFSRYSIGATGPLSSSTSRRIPTQFSRASIRSWPAPLSRAMKSRAKSWIPRPMRSSSWPAT